MIKTRLVATVGPACDDEATLGALIDAGVNVFRLNFSHGTLEEHGAALERIRRIARERGALVATLGDLCGPKIRLGRIEHGGFDLHEGDEIRIHRDPIDGTRERVGTSYAGLIDDVNVGHRILIDDGNVHLRVTGRQDDMLTCRCEVGGRISDRKGVNLPDSNVSAPTLTEKDHVDLDWAIRHDLDYIALSFVRRGEDLAELRGILEDRSSAARIVSKIERPEAVVHLDDIIDQSDVVLVARGDLGVEMDLWQVPTVQKDIALRCQRAGKPVIIATQMLQSMVDAPVPTRAEVSDVANAILDRADAVMLSAETSIGRHPLAAVRAMRKIAGQAELFGAQQGRELGINRTTRQQVTTAVAHGASLVAAELRSRLVVIWTEQGDGARLLSKHRLDQPLVALSPDERVCRQMCLYYGVVPIRLERNPDLDDMLCEVDRQLAARDLAAIGDRIVVVTGTRLDSPGETNALLIHLVGSGDCPIPILRQAKSSSP